MGARGMSRSAGLLHRRPSPALVVAFIALLIALGGTAYAATATIVNIADPTTPANVAKVDATGALKTSVVGTVNVRPLQPATPFNFTALSFTDGGQTGQFAPTSATVDMTGTRVANGTAGATNVDLYEYGFASTATSCETQASTGNRRFLGEFSVPAGQTADEQLTTPLVLKPLNTGGKWCVITFASGTNGAGFWITYNGYVGSGTFAAAAATPAAAPGVPAPRRR